MRIKNYIIILLLIIPFEIFSSGGSIYSRFGLGDFYYSISARRLGLGDLGIAVNDFDYLNNLNPASWSNLRLTRAETGVIYKGTNISSSSNSVFHSQTIFSGIMLGFPIEHDLGIALTGGVIPYSNVNYDIMGEETDPLVGTYKANYQGDGGLSKVFFGLSYRLPFNLSLGASFDYYTGQIKYTTAIDFPTDASYRDASYIKDYSHYGAGFTVGLISNNFAEIIGLENLSDIRIGVTYSSSVNLHTDTTNTSKTIIGDLISSSGTLTTELPYRFGIGLSFKLNNGYNFLLDYLHQPMSNFSSNNFNLNELRDFNKYSLGFEYRNPESRSQSFWEHVMYRGGLSFEQTQYSINGEGIDQISLFAGLSIPLGFDNTMDLALQIGKRGTTDNNLLSENIYKFSITFSIGELWFIRTDR